MGSVEDAERRMGAQAEREAAMRSQDEAALWARAEEVHCLLAERGVPEHPLSTSQIDDSGENYFGTTSLTARLVCVGWHNGPNSILRASSGRFYWTYVGDSSAPHDLLPSSALYGSGKVFEAHQMDAAFGDDEQAVHAMYSVLRHYRLEPHPEVSGSLHDYEQRLSLDEQTRREDRERGGPSGSSAQSNRYVRAGTGLPVAMRLTELERWLSEQGDIATADRVLAELPELWTPNAYQESTDEEMERLARLVRRVARLQPSTEATLAKWESEWSSAADHARVKAAEATARVLAAKVAVDAAKATRPRGRPLLDPVTAAPPRRSLLARLRASMRGEARSAPPPAWTNLPSLELELQQARSERLPEQFAREWETKATRLSRFMEAYRALT